jgi:DNA-binding PadR family transcriptional regulator
MNFMQGTLDVLILTALADGPLHGYDVVEWIRSATNDPLKIDDGAGGPNADSGTSCAIGVISQE